MMSFVFPPGSQQALAMGLGIAVTVAVLVFALREYRSLNGGYASFGQGFGLGAIATVISSVISSVVLYLNITLIDPGILNGIRDQQREAMIEKGLNDEQIEQGLEMAEKFSTPGMIVLFGIVGGILFGVIISLIVAAIMQRKRPEGGEWQAEDIGV